MQWYVFANETIRNYAVLNIFPFPKEHVYMHDSLASNHERGRSGMVQELKNGLRRRELSQESRIPVIKV